MDTKKTEQRDQNFRSELAQQLGEDIFSACEMIIKVKEPIPEEYDLFREDQILYTYLHLAANKELTETLMNKGVKGVA